MAAKKLQDASLDVVADESLVELLAIEPIRHSGTEVAPGEVFSASAVSADALIMSGAAVPSVPVGA